MIIETVREILTCTLLASLIIFIGHYAVYIFEYNEHKLQNNNNIYDTSEVDIQTHDEIIENKTTDSKKLNTNKFENNNLLITKNKERLKQTIDELKN